MPNILLFQTDDHGQWASSPYGNREIISPTLQWLADTGIRMDRAFTPCPVCSPARASTLTGLLPSQHGIHDYLQELTVGRDHPGIAPFITLAMRLQQAGYFTGHCGKWHAGRAFQTQPGYNFYVAPHRTNARFGEQPFHDNGRDLMHHGHQAPIITNAVLRFLDQHAATAGDRPFFCYVGYTDTHSPHTSQPQRLVHLYRDCTFAEVPDETFSPTHIYARIPAPADPAEQRDHLRQYYAAVTTIDEQIGRIIDELDSRGQLDNTLIVYTSDHGHMNGHHGLYSKGNATIPQTLIDESIRVPLLMRWPGILRPGTCDAFVDHCDLYETLLDAAGVPSSQDGPGRSCLPLLRGENVSWRDAQFCEYANARMIRTADKKLIVRYPGPNGHWPDEFYDMAIDPRERTNRIDDPAYATIIAELRQRIETHFTQYEDPARTGLRAWEQPRHNNWEVWALTPEEVERRRSG